jgi:hypothetical protein
VSVSLTNVTAVPEPHESLQLCIGALVLGAWLRRKRRWAVT